uniref:Methylaspartate mutase n=1 Tax=Streptomyces sp. NBC_01393 TaxID=2903851 RepID=A0AAU3I1X3_9ACTN
MRPATSGFGDFVGRAQEAGRLVVQPRMGMSDPAAMRAGLLATKRAAATTVGTLTIDSYTRVGEDAAARKAIAEGIALNGYPIATHPRETTRAVLADIRDERFPVQVRHGSAGPLAIFRAMAEAGLDATEGGPVSYCLPYSRMPLRHSIANWAECCELLSRTQELGARPHLETFGGCLLGQLCPPSLLIAMSILEALFFRQYGIRSVSLSYAQQTHHEQDREAVAALHRIADELLPDVDRHVVLYAYMGVYPSTPGGALALLEQAAVLAVRTGAARLIVKTTAEAHRIPTIGENVIALETAASAARRERGMPATSPVFDTGIHAEARSIVAAVLELDTDIGAALEKAFAIGRLDVPYCLHPDNAGRTRGVIDGEGRLQWAQTGGLPIAPPPGGRRPVRATSSGLLTSLSYVARTFDQLALGGVPAHPHLETTT